MPVVSAHARSFLRRMAHHQPSGKDFLIESVEVQEQEVVALACDPDHAGQEEAPCLMLPAHEFVHLDEQPLAAE